MELVHLGAGCIANIVLKDPAYGNQVVHASTAHFRLCWVPTVHPLTPTRCSVGMTGKHAARV
jgi:hypothetical protein